MKKHFSFLVLDILFFSLIFMILGLNAWYAGAQDFDPHWGYLTYLASISAQGLIAGLDYISGYAFIIPSIQGWLINLFGLSQVNLFLASNLALYSLFMLLVYKINRLFLNRFWSKLSVVLLLLAFTGLGLPWFNKTMIVFVALGLYLSCCWLIKPRLYLLIITSLLVASFPYLRYQAIFISLFFFMIPGLAYYFGLLSKAASLKATAYLIGIFILSHASFLGIVALSGKFSNYLETMAAIFSFSREVAPVLTKGYSSIFSSIINTLFNFSTTTLHRWGGMDHAVRDWVFVFLSGLYFSYKLLAKKLNQEPIKTEDFILLLLAGTVFASYPLIYPHVSEHRAQAQFGLGLGLLVKFLLDLFKYQSPLKLKAISIGLIFMSLFYIYYGRINMFIAQTQHSYSYMVENKHTLTKFIPKSAYTGMLLEADVAKDLEKALTIIRQQEQAQPNIFTIFHGPWYEKYGKLLAISAKNFRLHSHTVINDFALAEDIKPYLLAHKPLLILQNSDNTPYANYHPIFNSDILNLKILKADSSPLHLKD